MLINKLGFQVFRMADDGGTPSPSPSVAPAASPAPSQEPSPSGSPSPSPSPSDGGTPSPSPAPSSEVAPTWAPDWRQKALAEAGVPADDKKALGILERYTSPGDVVKKMLEQEKLIRSGEFKKPLAKDATPEQQAAWRKENNIPEAPDKYDLTLPDGLVIGEADKPIVNNLLQTMHGMNLNNDQVKQVLAAYYKQEKEYIAARQALVDDFSKKQDAMLHESWGKEFTPNDNSITNLLNTFTESTRTALEGALDSSMMPLMKNASFKRDMAMLARALNPHDIVTDPSSTSQGSSVADELAAITKLMADKTSAYWKGPLVNGKDTELQARYLQLTSWQEAQKKKK